MTSVISPSRYRTSHTKWVGAWLLIVLRGWVQWMLIVLCGSCVTSSQGAHAQWTCQHLFTMPRLLVSLHDQSLQPSGELYAGSWPRKDVWGARHDGWHSITIYNGHRHKHGNSCQVVASQLECWSWLLIVCRIVKIPSRLCGRLFYLWVCHKPQHSIQILGNCKIEEHNHVRTTTCFLRMYYYKHSLN